MANSLLELLAVKEWTPAHAAQVGYTTGGALETPPAPPANPNTADTYVQTHLAYRFARVQARNGNLLVRVLKPTDAQNPTLGSGDLCVFNGTADVFQLPYGGTIFVGGDGATVNGSVVWGR